MNSKKLPRCIGTQGLSGRTFSGAIFKRPCLLGVVWLFICNPTFSHAESLTPEVVRAKIVQEPIVRHWTVRDGLPVNNINSIAQDGNGRIWLATPAGITRFDGAQFETYTEANNPVLAEATHFASDLIGTEDGSMWFAMRKGLVRYSAGTFEVVNRDWGKRIDLFMHARPNGLWIGIPRRLIRFHHDRIVEEIPIKRVSKMFQGPGDSLIVKARNRKSRVQWITGPDRTIGPIVTRGRDFTQDSTGAFWYFNERDRVTRRFDRNGVIERRSVRVIEATADGRPQPDLLNRLSTTPFALNGNHVLLIEKNELLYFKGRGPWFQDRDDNFWVGTPQNGLFYIRYPLIQTLLIDRPGKPFKENDIWSVCEASDHSIWWAAANEIVRFNPEENRALRFFKNYPSNQRKTIWCDNDDRLWTGHGILEGKDVESWPTSVRGFRFSSFQAEDGSTLLGTSKGIYRLKEGNLEHFTTDHGLGSNQVIAFLADASGAVWIGTHGGGVSRLQNGQLHTYTVADGLGSNTAAPAMLDSDGSLWFASAGGLTRWRNDRFQTVQAADGLYSDTVLSIQQDDHGWLWMNCHKGIFRVQKQELLDFFEGKTGSVTSIVYDEADGMLAAEGNGGYLPNSCKTSDGRLLFPTIKGVAVIDPERAHQWEDHSADSIVNRVQANQ
jgi:ligand-binding sensor domain-containing protein